MSEFDRYSADGNGIAGVGVYFRKALIIKINILYNNISCLEAPSGRGDIYEGTGLMCV